MDELLTRIWDHLSGRVTGPMSFRVFMQPVMAMYFAVRAGLHDAKAGRPAFFWAILIDPRHRRDLLAQGWKDFGKIFVLAVVLDVVYQLLVLRWVYPFETLLVAFLLACVPYVLIRGPVNRIARWWRPRTERAGLR